jgi:hypothetical protein
VLIARFADRVGKGIRAAPRDALVADVTPAEQRGEAFGLRQSLDTVGAILGPVTAIGLMVLLRDDIRTVLWFAVIPAVISVDIGLSLPREPYLRSPASAKPSSSSARRKAALRSLGRRR